MDIGKTFYSDERQHILHYRTVNINKLILFSFVMLGDRGRACPTSGRKIVTCSHTVQNKTFVILNVSEESSVL